MTLQTLRATLIATLVLLAATATATATFALDSPPRLANPVTDQAGVLTPAEESQVAGALDQLRADHGVQLFVAYIDTTGGENVDTFTEATAHASSLGGNDALILVAIDDRTYSMWVGPTLDEITDAEIDTILTETLEPRLVDGDFAGAMIASAEAVGQAVDSGAPVVTAVPATAGPAVPVPGGTGTGTGSGSSPGLDLTPVIAFLLVAGGLLLVGRTLLVRRRQGKVRAAELDALNTQANRALLATDEALKDAGNDVEFAAAQWGEGEVGPYREAIAGASAELRAAFALRQRLDDASPELPPERDAMLREIVGRCTNAGQLLDAQEQRFDQLRDLEAAAPAQLATLPTAIEALRARRTAAETTAGRLRTAYAPSATGSVNGNVEEAAKALDAAAAEATRGAGVVGTRPSEGVVALRRAQEAMARATQLIEAVERLAAGLDQAAARLPAELEAADQRDVAAARDAVGSIAAAPPPAPGGPGTSPAADPAADPAAALRAVEAALDEAHRAAGAIPADPLAALQRAVAANQAADVIVAQVADANAQAARRRQVAEAAVAAAQGHVTRAVDYITTRRHGVGQEARTRAAEAEVGLEQARGLLGSDSEGATSAANRAAQLADEAYRLAAGQFEGWSAGTGPVAGPYHQGGGEEIAGAVIGGIIGALLSGAASGGRGHGSGWGGSPWGGTGGGSAAGGFGLPSGPVFGGGGGRTHGGGFGMPSGGGGRVRGGRW